MRKESTSFECIITIVREILPEGNFRHRMQLAIARYLDQNREGLSFGILPTVICGAISGKTEKAIPVTAAWQLIQLAAKLFDDIEDGDATDRTANTTNLASGFLFASHSALDRLIDYGVPLEQSHQVKVGLNRACLRACAGQDSDFHSGCNREFPDPARWLEIAKEKSGSLFAWASQAGGIVAGVDEAIQGYLWEYGLRLGTLVQIADDFNGIWGPAGEIDLLNCHQWSLPIAYTYFVGQPAEKNALIDLIQKAAQGNHHAAQTAREQISSLGAQKYVLAVACIQRIEAIQILNNIPLSLPAHQRLMVILDRIFPVLAQVGASSHESNSGSIITPP